MNMGSLIDRLFFFLLFSNIFLAICVTSLVFETYFILFHQIPEIKYPLFLFCSTLSLYCFHRLYRFDFSADRTQLSERHIWIKENKILFFTVFGLAIIGVLISILFFISLKTVFYLSPIAATSFAYTVHCIPTRKGWIRLRDVPGIKIITISLVLGLTTVLLPVFVLDDLSLIKRPEVIMVFFRRVLFIFAITIPFDIRDVDYDGANGTRTIPVVYGIAKAKTIAVIALFLFFISAAVQYFVIPNSNPYYSISLSISTGMSILAILLTNEKRKDVYYSFFVEGMMLLQCLLVMAVHKL